MIPGEPLIDYRPPITPPGVHHRNPVDQFVRHVGVCVLVGLIVIGTIAWFWAISPTEKVCIPPPLPGPGVEYTGANNRWSINGATVGYAQEEDDECLTPTP